ncbi:MAG TPA: SET domain-containing protein-lysine N-methyltransferase [Oligoflexia bacterium]|nr:SET domain-containing protein-lysine N-methyltransferase [Oligoflexia bacterium]HMR25712.1 SET domain-containing protein-lysine N-methyltransferase [Oligoflexia bacterium]
MAFVLLFICPLIHAQNTEPDYQPFMQTLKTVLEEEGYLERLTSDQLKQLVTPNISERLQLSWVFKNEEKIVLKDAIHDLKPLANMLLARNLEKDELKTILKRKINSFKWLKQKKDRINYGNCQLNKHIRDNLAADNVEYSSELVTRHFYVITKTLVSQNRPSEKLLSHEYLDGLDLSEEDVLSRLRSKCRNLNIVIHDPNIPEFNFGKGMFATERIEAGTIIGRYTGELEGLVDDESYLMKNYGSIINAKKVGNHTRYINHSPTEANLELYYANDEGIVEPFLMTIKDIDPGQELLFNYGTEYQNSGFYPATPDTRKQ